MCGLAGWRSNNDGGHVALFQRVQRTSWSVHQVVLAGVSPHRGGEQWALDSQTLVSAQSLGHEGLNNMLAAYEDKSAYAQCIFAYTNGPGQPVTTFVGQVRSPPCSSVRRTIRCLTLWVL